MESKRSIPLRLAKLNQQIDGKVAASSFNQLMTRDGLLDSLLALYDECERKLAHHHRNPPQHIASFVRKGGIHLSLGCGSKLFVYDTVETDHKPTNKVQLGKLIFFLCCQKGVSRLLYTVFLCCVVHKYPMSLV